MDKINLTGSTIHVHVNIDDKYFEEFIRRLVEDEKKSDKIIELLGQMLKELKKKK